ncbi:MAG: hypothetical protein ACYDEJ_04310 [Desulfitobacteriaceae bacterium]
MNIVQPFVTLYFDEEDSDIWGALQLIEPEKRNSFIKGALRCVLVAGLNPESFYSGTWSLKQKEDQLIHGHSEELAVQENSVAEEIRVLETGRENVSFDLTDLICTEESTSDCLVMSSNSSQAPWEHLLYNVIGVEEDEVVLGALGKIIKPVVERSDNLEKLKTQEVGKVADVVKEKEQGFAARMNNISLEDLKLG